MKKVTLILPDFITRVIGTSAFSKKEEIELTSENLILVLSHNADYHEDYGFQPDDIEIVSIEPLI